ncbi:MAG: hypothetical protein F6J98_10040 [Moorea sp. SIO4G2]|nr:MULTISPECIES: hypothetical protein [unclassified Moorena]NEO12925.1 hypothetical protein [Moorena sp. SIO3E8]NEO60751.1 hypothetical protein [Moorena sp. SIO4G2]NEP99905.1 hypothetical protein [Moorena sp. SIO3F7]
MHAKVDYNSVITLMRSAISIRCSYPRKRSRSVAKGQSHQASIKLTHLGI